MLQANNPNMFVLSQQKNLIFDSVTCKSSRVIYLMECCLFTNSQYIGKSEYSMNWRINTHRHEVWRADDPQCDKHFQNPGHKFNEHAIFMIIEKINNASLRKQQRRSHLEHIEGFRILKLTFSPKGLNISLKVISTTKPFFVIK